MIPPAGTGPCGFAGLRRASRAVSHLYDLVLAPTQLKITQYTMLRQIAEAGEIAHCDLARTSVGSEETFSRRLASARKCGWVSMRIGDRQRRVYRLTEKGAQVLREATPYWERAQDRMRRELGDTDWQTLLTLAQRVADAAIRAESAPRRNSRPFAADPLHAAMMPVPLSRKPQDEHPAVTAA
jgi:DNA-binding MarR family transcriptional regulator